MSVSKRMEWFFRNYNFDNIRKDGVIVSGEFPGMVEQTLIEIQRVIGKMDEDEHKKMIGTNKSYLSKKSLEGLIAHAKSARTFNDALDFASEIAKEVE